MYFYFLSQELRFYPKSQVPKDFHSGKVFSNAGFKAWYGGVSKFYKDFYINSPFPLAIVRADRSGKQLNANYYDDPQLFAMVKDFMIDSLRKHIRLNLNTSEVFILGKKNALFIQKLNKEAKLFDKMTVLEHPRYIEQYKSKDKQVYIDKYLSVFGCW